MEGMEGTEEKDYQSMELEPYDGSKPSETDDGNLFGSHRLYYCEDDVAAGTSDPIKMLQNIRMPVAYLISREGFVEMACDVDPMDEFVISPEYFRSVMPKKPRSIEAVRRKFAERHKTHPLTTICREEIYCLPVTILKSKNGISKYNKMERKKLRIERRETRNASRNASQRKVIPVPIACTTTVGKVDWYHTVTLGSVSRLAYQECVNEEVLDYGVALALKRHRNGPDVFSTDVHGWTSFFYSKNDKKPKPPENYFRQLRKQVKNLLALKYLVIPALRESHWFLVIVCQPFPDEATVLDLERKAGGGEKMRPYSKLLYHDWLCGKRRPTILIFDSLVSRPNHKSHLAELNGFHNETAIQIRAGLFALHKQLWKQTGRNIDFGGEAEEYFRSQIPSQVMQAPGQKGVNECGLFVVTYVAMWFTELKKVNDDYMTIYKKNFAGVFPYYGCENLRYELFKTIEEYCSSNPDLLKEVMKHEVKPWPIIKTEPEKEPEVPII